MVYNAFGALVNGSVGMFLDVIFCIGGVNE